MAAYSVRGFTGATAATADHTIAALWNPDSVKRLCLLEHGCFKAGAGTANDSVYITRITTKGTPASDVTPDADNAWLGDDTPGSGALLSIGAYSAQPTKASPPLFGWVASAAAGSGYIWPTPRGIWVPPGTGIAIVQRAATAWPTSEVYFVWEE